MFTNLLLASHNLNTMDKRKYRTDFTLLSNVDFCNFFACSAPNGDGISCFKTVNVDDNDKNASLLNEIQKAKISKFCFWCCHMLRSDEWKNWQKSWPLITRNMMNMMEMKQLTYSNMSCWLNHRVNQSRYHLTSPVELNRKKVEKRSKEISEKKVSAWSSLKY